MRFRLMATYRGVPYEAGMGPSSGDVVLFAACPPPEELGFEPAPGHWRKQVIRAEVDALWESRPVGIFGGEPCMVLDDLGDRLHITYIGTDPARAARLGYWQVDRGVFELLAPREVVTGLAEERVDKPLRWTGQATGSTAAPAHPYAGGAWPTVAPPDPGLRPVPDPAGPGLVPDPTGPGLVPDPTGPGLVPDPTGPGLVPGPTGPGLVPGQVAHQRISGPAGPWQGPDPTSPGGAPDPAGLLPVPEPAAHEPVPEPAAHEPVPGTAGAARESLPPAPAPGGRAARRQRVPTQEIFCELADLAGIPRAAYALETETSGALCLVRSADGFEVFLAAAGARHEVRHFADEEAAFFYLFGVLVAEAVRNGTLTPGTAPALSSGRH